MAYCSLHHSKHFIRGSLLIKHYLSWDIYNLEHNGGFHFGCFYLNVLQLHFDLDVAWVYNEVLVFQIFNIVAHQVYEIGVGVLFLSQQIIDLKELSFQKSLRTFIIYVFLRWNKNTLNCKYASTESWIPTVLLVLFFILLDYLDNDFLKLWKEFVVRILNLLRILFNYYNRLIVHENKRAGKVRGEVAARKTSDAKAVLKKW